MSEWDREFLAALEQHGITFDSLNVEEVEVAIAARLADLTPDEAAQTILNMRAYYGRLKQVTFAVAEAVAVFYRDAVASSDEGITMLHHVYLN